MTETNSVTTRGSLRFVLRPPAWTFVPVATGGAVEPLPRPVLVETIHDGELIPAEVLPRERVQRAGALARLEAAHCRERDWGADLFAGALARALGLAGFGRVGIARALLDVGRLAGVAAPGDDHLERRAIGATVAPLLAAGARRRLLGRYHGGAWRAQTRAALAATGAAGRGVLRLAVHTYDPIGADDRLRPALSLLTRARGIGVDAGWEPLAEEVFGSRVPAWVGSSTVRPALADALLAELIAYGLEVTANDPYELPLGSLEVRLAAWWFRRRLRAAAPIATAAGGDAARRRAAWRARYQGSLRRLDTLVVEVRKDMLWRFDGELPQGPRANEAELLARRVAGAVRSALGG